MTKLSLQKWHVERSLDVRGKERGKGYQQAKAVLDEMVEDQILELYLDEGEPLRSIPFGLRADGHAILISEPYRQGVRLLIRKQNGRRGKLRSWKPISALGRRVSDGWGENKRSHIWTVGSGSARTRNKSL